jgi:transposase
MGFTIAQKHGAAAREERRNRVAAHVLAGHTYRDIAAALSVSLGTVAADMQQVIERWRTEQLELINTQRQLDLSRLDKALTSIWHKVEEGDLQAIDRMIKLIQERSKLLGSYAPEKAFR